ncbi:MAG: large conductance mechanosensitive channel protein MscL [Clostridia bacterium]|nr:large conductance mechanosensitive channel protein MscL [Clostridia bacterium]
MKKFLEEFKTFAMKGNMIDLAVGVVIGGAFSKIVTMLVECIITPLISLVLGLITGQSSTDALFGSIIVGPFPIGQLISTIIDFIITAFVLFAIVKAINKIEAIGRKEEEPAAPTTKECPFCKSEINIDATRCPHCTSEL